MINYLILNEIISSTISIWPGCYSLKEVYTSNIGASLNFIAICIYTVFPICGYMDLYLDLFQDLLLLKAIDCKALRCSQVNIWFSWIYLEGTSYNCYQCRHKFTIDSRRCLTSKDVRYTLFSRIQKIVQN